MKGTLELHVLILKLLTDVFSSKEAVKEKTTIRKLQSCLVKVLVLMKQNWQH